MSTSDLQSLIQTYCLFTFVCFEPPPPSSHSPIPCPDYCQCFTAPLDDGVPNQTLSLICERIDSLQDERFPKPEQYFILNSLIIRAKNEDFQPVNNPTTNIAVRHLTLQGFNGQFSNIGNQKPTIFDWLDTTAIKSLSFIECNHNVITYDSIAFDFAKMKHFSELQVLRFERCSLEIMDEDFNSCALHKLHTVFITRSKLEYIHRQAFHTKARQLRRIIVAENQLTNLKWITSVPEPFESLWQLDLSHNRLRILPIELIDKLPNLNVLYVHGNNFKWFELNTLQPWFKIQEFRLSNTDTNVLYVNDRMQWISEFPSISKQIHSSFTMDSFLNHYHYCTEEEGLVKMDYLLKNLGSLLFRSYIPDRLIIDNIGDHGQLIINHCDVNDNSVQMNDPIYLIGLEISPVLIRHKDSFFKTRFLLENAIPPMQIVRTIKHAIKLPLMNMDMWNIWMNGQDKLTVDEVILWIDIVCELLDLVYTKGQYVMLTLWPYENSINFAMPSDLLHAENFKLSIIKPLLDEIGNHPALIGIEIVDNAFYRQLSNSKQNLDPEKLDGCPYDEEFLRQIRDEMEFISYHVRMFEDFTSEHMIGIGMDSNCKPCLPLLLIDECLFGGSIKNEANVIDFVTIRSAVSATNSEYGHRRLQTDYQKWFSQHSKMNSIDKKHLFYSIYGDDVTLSDDDVQILKQFTMGYFTPSYYNPFELHNHNQIRTANTTIYD
ncbi:uncharacterized protein LOC124496140 [Dermatophagoides farinae]|uniref:uncharacterized protein LOC124496140 n=1 Tax=Dermatophagoides farinae TaxID=6954 RepID=UPI003F5FDAE5